MREKVGYTPPGGGGSPRLVPQEKPCKTPHSILNVNPVQLLYRAEVAPILGEIWLKSRKKGPFLTIFCQFPPPGDPPGGGPPPWAPGCRHKNSPPGTPPEGGDPPLGVADGAIFDREFPRGKVAAQGPPLGEPLLGPPAPPPEGGGPPPWRPPGPPLRPPPGPPRAPPLGPPGGGYPPPRGPPEGGTPPLYSVTDPTVFK